MALAKISFVNKSIKFEICMPGVIITLIMFLVILVFVFIKEYISLVNTDITKLIYATSIYQNENNKNKTYKGILGLIVIIIAYVIILYYKKFNIQFPIAIMITVLMVILGTTLLFKGFFTFIVSKLIDNKNFLYKGTNVLSYNNIIFRIRDNNKVLGQIAILITCCLTSAIVAITTKSLLVQGKDSEYPYSLTYIGDINNEVVNNAINLSKEKIDYKLTTEVIPYEVESSQIPLANNINIIKFSEIENIVNNRELNDKILKHNLKNNQALLILPKNYVNGFNFNISIDINGEKFNIIDSAPLSLFGLFKENKITLAVNNSAYNELSKTIGKDKFNITTITLKNFDNTKEIASYIRNNSDIDLYSVNEFNPNDYGFINAIYFIGLFLALVFVISVGSIMYFKCISDASKDKRRFDILRRIGTNQKYINKAIYKQIGIFFMIPALVSITHSIVAGYAITDLFNQNSILLTSTTIVSFLAIYLIYYILTARKYISLTK